MPIDKPLLEACKVIALQFDKDGFWQYKAENCRCYGVECGNPLCPQWWYDLIKNFDADELDKMVMHYLGYTDEQIEQMNREALREDK